MHINAHYGCQLKIHYKITSDDWCRCKIVVTKFTLYCMAWSTLVNNC
jgi:hypothetical protein